MLANNKKTKQKSFFPVRVLILALLTCTFFVRAGAQGGDTPPTGGGTGETDVPFDGGITLLVGAGVAYGFKEWQKKRKDGLEQKDII